VKIGGVVLAAGESRRMGFAKLLLRHRGQSLLARAVGTAAQVCDAVWVVVGAFGRSYRDEAEAAGATVVMNPDWEEGLASSLRRGVEALPPEIGAALILLADQPFVEEEHLRALLERRRTEGCDLVLSRYRDVLGAPALVARSLFPQLAALRGERGARALVRTASSVGEVPLQAPQDVDTPEDAASWLEP